MASDSWLAKMKSAISTSMDSVRSTIIPDTITTRRTNIGILAFEVASLMSKLVHTWRSLSDPQIARLRHETIVLESVRKIVSDDDTFLLGLACAELAETLRLVADAVSVLSKRCADQQLREFDRAFEEFTKSGLDPNRWAMSWKEMDAKAKKMDKYVTSTAALYKDIDELSESEHGLKKLLQSNSSQILKSSSKIAAVADMQQKIFRQRQEVKYLRQTSLWGCTFDTAVSLLVRSTFTVLARIKNVFGIGPHEAQLRGVPVSAVVYPETLLPPLFELSSVMVVPPETTLGASALALHYANVVVVIEKMIRTPRLVGPDARDDLYGMLPASLRGLLRARLRGVGWVVATDAKLAVEWRAAMARIVRWLSPIAQSTIKWQSERSFERRSAATPRANVLLLQTLYFANREKVEAAIAELLVGLNYVWRFEIEMCLELKCR